ncbi:MAG: undecaprenyldiphospho-muramoylpentapeptide beta-N-acetylglucosaminyltransferase [Gemmatimonadota bacterium]|nr:undecaprenyldiphospho-muramoylpentapeptide beta-N-acetylglucosaminyltransferase [Gemmatimonadota bacterium]
MHEAPVVVFSGGGTGGHLYPALAVAEALREIRPDARILFMGSERGIEGRILAERGEWHELLPIRGIDRANPLRSLRDAFGAVRSIARSLRLFSELRPEAVVVTGGYAGAPAGIAAALMGIPLVLQEQNAVPGLVTKLLSRWATDVHVAFPEAVERLPARRERAWLSGNPVRPVARIERGRARARLGLPEDGAVVLVVGGSQGALQLNRVLLEAVRDVVEAGGPRPGDLHLLWATGPNHHETVCEALDTHGDAAGWVHAVPYIEEMPVALAASDLAVARAGATFTAELLVQALPAVLVPLPTAAEDHQLRNGEALAAAGAAVVLPQATLTASRLWSTVTTLLDDPARLEAMKAAARGLARPHAAVEIGASVAALLPRTSEAA